MDGDGDLEALRQKRMAEMQSKRQQQEAKEEQKQMQDEQKRIMLAQLLTGDARERRAHPPSPGSLCWGESGAYHAILLAVLWQPWQ